MISQLTRIPQNSQISSPLMPVWKNSIQSLERPEQKTANKTVEDTKDYSAVKNVKIFPRALMNKLFIANLALNHYTNAANPNLGLWDTLRSEKLQVVSQLAGQGIYA